MVWWATEVGDTLGIPTEVSDVQFQKKTSSIHDHTLEFQQQTLKIRTSLYSKVNSMLLNGHTFKFHPQAQNIELLYHLINNATGKDMLNTLKDHTLEFHQQTLRLEPPRTAK